MPTGKKQLQINAKIVVNADDFGYSETINKAILKSFDSKIISTTTLMCNMPGFEEACEIAHNRNLKERIGIHLNLSEGQPLTEPIKKLPKFYKNGQMYKSFKGHLLSKEENKAVITELEAQLDKCRKMRINPTHCDSHHHMHHYWGIGKAVNFLALKFNIPAVRLRFNWGKLSLQRRLYSGVYNFRLKTASLAKTKYFCEIRSVSPDLLMKKTIIEVMVHPVLNSKDDLVNYVNGSDLNELMREYLPTNHFIKFKDL